MTPKFMSPEVPEPNELLEFFLPLDFRFLDLLPCKPPFPTCSLPPHNFHFPNLIPPDPPFPKLLWLDQLNGLRVGTEFFNGLSCQTKEKRTDAIRTLKHKLSSGMGCGLSFVVFIPPVRTL